MVLNCRLLEDIHRQLPKQVIILRDFNAYNIMWGSVTTDARRREIEEFIARNNINIMTDGAPTHITYYAETAIDLTMCTATLEADLHSSAAASPVDSDHCPVFVTYEQQSREQQNEGSKHWKIKEARWQVYEASESWDNLPNELIRRRLWGSND